MLIEKQWAKINGYYEVISGGYMKELFDFIGGVPHTDYWISSYTSNSTALWSLITDSFSRGYVIAAGTSGDTYLGPYGLVTHHAYSIVNALQFTTLANNTY